MNIFKNINQFFAVILYPFVIDKDEQIKMLAKFREPSDLIERSYFQFRIQFDIEPVHKRVLKNFIGFFAFFYFATLGIIGRVRVKANNKNGSVNLAIFPYKNFHYPDVIPEELKSEFAIQKIDFMSAFVVQIQDIKFIFEIFFRYPFQFYFLSKCISKILFYRYIIRKYNPVAIFSCAEYSFTSSISTLFGRENNIEHINIMHGDKFFLIKDSFFEFDRFYIWDDFYKDLFIRLRASPSQFRVGTFSHLRMSLTNHEEIYSYTYYLAREPKDILLKIKSTLEKIDKRENICIRFHPRYSSEEIIKSIFRGFAVQNPMNVPLESSFSKTKNVISLYSSCLTQAYFNQKKIIIDDINHSSEKLKALRDSDYIVFSKPHELLSNIMMNSSYHAEQI